MADSLALGVDIGGTKVACALVDSAGHVLAEHRVPTNPDGGTDALLDRIAAAIQHRLDGAPGQVVGVGIGCPGHVDPTTGIVRNAVNLGWLNVPLRYALESRLPDCPPIHVHNDAKAAALGEMIFGAARDCRDFVYIAIGTGLGMGAVVDGRLLNGSNFFASEMGHLMLDPDGRRAETGLHGSPDLYISGNGLLAGWHEHAPNFPDSPLAQMDMPTTETILSAAEQADPLALTIMGEARRYLRTTLLNCIGMLNPALFVLAGGLGHAAADYWLDGLEDDLRRSTLPPAHEHLRVTLSQVTSSAVGAASLVWYNRQ